MYQIVSQLVNWLRAQKGQDLVEYAVLLALIALVVWAVVSLGGEQVSLTWQAIVAGLTSITTAAGG